MKTKLFFTLTIILLLLGCRENSLSVSANTMMPNHFNYEEIEHDDSTLSLEYLKDATWDDLSAISVVTEEDDFCCRLISSISKPAGIGSIQNVPYVKTGLGIDCKDTVPLRITKKINEIIRIYNEGNSYNLTLETSTTQYSTYTLLNINSTNLIVLENPITHLGQTATLKAGSVYWSSSNQFGSGNPFTTKSDLSVTVNGVSYLSFDGTIMSSTYIPFNDLVNSNDFIEVMFSRIRYLHICVDEKDYGWVHPNDLITD